MSGATAIVLALTQGPVVAVLALLMLGAGLLYDYRLKPTAWAWACFSVAFALLPVYAWYGSTGQLPPLAQFLLPLAALAGPALQLSNGLVDLERDSAGGLATLATRLGRGRTLAIIAALLIVIYGLAWLTLSLQTDARQPGRGLGHGHRRGRLRASDARGGQCARIRLDASGRRDRPAWAGLVVGRRLVA